MNYPKPEILSLETVISARPGYISVPQYGNRQKIERGASPNIAGSTSGMSSEMKALIGIGAAVLIGVVAYKIFNDRKRR